MRLVAIENIKRINDTFHFRGHTIKALRKASDGYGVLVIFEAPTQLDRDFQEPLFAIHGPDCFCWFPTAKELNMIKAQLDLSDRQTRDELREGKGWNVGPRPIADFM